MQDKMTSNKGNFKTYLLCVLFCVFTGFTYGILKLNLCPISETSASLLSIGNSVAFFGLGFAINSLRLKRMKQAMFYLLSTILAFICFLAPIVFFEFNSYQHRKDPIIVVPVMRNPDGTY